MSISKDLNTRLKLEEIQNSGKGEKVGTDATKGQKGNKIQS